MAWDATGRQAWDMTDHQGGREWQQLQQSQHIEREPRHPGGEEASSQRSSADRARGWLTSGIKYGRACIAPLTGPHDERIESSL